MKVYALVGKSGTGKSYKALNLAHDYNIELVIDDGLLIHNSRLLAGKSAKREETMIAAVKRAIFHYEDHRNEIRDILKNGEYRSILLIGTSDRMVEKIAKNLEINPIDQLIYIEEISTKEEINIAKIQRHKKGKHIIPLPSLELKKDFSGYLLDKVKHILKRNDKEHIVSEKTITRPTFSFYGKFSISNHTLKEIIRISSKSIDKIKVIKSKIFKSKSQINILIIVEVEYGLNWMEEIKLFQQHIIDNIHHMTSINIIKCNVEIKNLKIKI